MNRQEAPISRPGLGAGIAVVWCGMHVRRQLFKFVQVGDQRREEDIAAVRSLIQHHAMLVSIAVLCGVVSRYDISRSRTYI